MYGVYARLTLTALAATAGLLVLSAGLRDDRDVGSTTSGATGEAAPPPERVATAPAREAPPSSSEEPAPQRETQAQETAAEPGAAPPPDGRIRWSAAAEVPWRLVRPTLEVGPETPPPPPRSRRVALLERALAERDAAAFEEAVASRVADAALLQDLLTWRRAFRGDGVAWTTLQALIARRPDWPLTRRMRATFERGLERSGPPSAIRAFFDAHPPLTARGARLYGEALIALGEAEAGRSAIIAAFRTMAAPQEEVEAFLAAHAALLTPHIAARHDALLIAGEFDAARALQPRLDEARADLTTAVSAVRRGARDAQRRVEALPEALRDHAALYVARFRRLARNRRRAPGLEALMLEATAAGRLGDPALWYRARKALARDALEAGRGEVAYELASGHGLDEGAPFAELEWFAGWVALTALADARRALPHFERLYANTSSAISRGRAAYWAAMAAPNVATRQRWLRLSAENGQSFYGQLAAERLGVAIDVAPPAPPSAGAFAAALSSPIGRAAALLYDAGLRRNGRMFVEAMARSDPSESGLSASAAVARALGDPWAEIRVGKVGEARRINLYAALFPAPAAPAFSGRTAPGSVLLGIARVESRFDHAAGSHAGALGLMQLMPGTARETARGLGLPYERARLTADPAYNLALGDAHIATVIDYYGGDVVLGVAAYNAGPGNVNRWLRRFGDPREGWVDPIWWIEMIPFDETRNYVMRVLEGRQIYAIRLGEVARGPRLGADLGLRRRRAPADG